VAAGDVVRAAKRAAHGVEDGRARARIVRERVVAMIVVFVDAVARMKWIIVGVGECVNIDGDYSDWLEG